VHDPPMTEDERTTVAAGYDALVGRFDEWAGGVADPARDELFATFIGHLAPGARVLDVGCGSGGSWRREDASRFAVTGIDISPRQIEAARRAVPAATFLVADVTAIEFDPDSFDAAVALYSIGHLPAREHASVFARLARWLRPGGLLLASLPADEDPGSRGPWIAGVEMCFASLGTAGYEQVLRDQGWQVIETRADVADEPEGPASFFWLLARAPASSRS
jgi:SAM-dependent methyltransferase